MVMADHHRSMLQLKPFFIWSDRLSSYWVGAGGGRHGWYCRYAAMIQNVSKQCANECRMKFDVSVGYAES